MSGFKVPVKKINIRHKKIKKINALKIVIFNYKY